ncbi:response regulator transcription factor [Achromobacter aloeverae]|uniref:DNA-binding response regulator n=1 Tax=Achromobacter aloeverae TaxID=1750518 RepID=A0A4Q1HPE1_9BURK|nr:response regulator transcription factor [Achromobacter aloeverae]RXN91404.1 DNA-binding response regulator [Achromobacter aloeverae]
MRILLVEDDSMLGDALRAGLAADGADVDWARTLTDAQLALVDHDYRAVLLDLGLPAGSGLALLKALRGRFDTTPVLIITARDRLSERIKGLDAGADDYLVKPFQLDELLARLRAVLRRSSNSVVSALRCRDVVLEPAGRIVKRGGQEVSLSAHEYHTLLALMQRMGQTVSRDQLEVAVYGSSGTIESNTVAVYIHQLRRKLGEGLIETQHGLGYRMVAGTAP